MIRKLQKVDINRVADIWLKTNLKALQTAASEGCTF